MRHDHIPVMIPAPVKADFLSPRIASISAPGVFSNRGPQVLELESRLAAWFGVLESRVVVTANATAALTAAIALSPATSWHLPAWSFPATVLAPLAIGKKVTFVDIDPDWWYKMVQRSHRSTGLINVIPFGGSFDQSAWSYQGELVVDAAASLASQPQGLEALPDEPSWVL